MEPRGGLTAVILLSGRSREMSPNGALLPPQIRAVLNPRQRSVFSQQHPQLANVQRTRDSEQSY